LAETIRLVHSALSSLNEQQLDTTQRFDCLEIYRPTVLRLFETLEPLRMRQLSMSRAQRRETISGASDLFSSQASGYKLVLMQLYEQASPGEGVDMFGSAVNRAVEALANMLHDCFRFYRTVPTVLVSELHQLYRLARRAGLLEVSLTDAEGQPGLTTTMLYKCSMLLSLTDPGRRAEGEIDQLAEVCRAHAGTCRIVQGGNWNGSGDGLFLLDIAGEKLPRPCTGLTAPVTTGEPYILDTTDMQTALRRRIAGIPALVRLRSPEAIMLQHLMTGERGPGLRREERRRDDRRVGLHSGLENIHAWLLQRAGKPATAAAPLECRVLDSSTGGLKLQWQAGGAGDARVGDLLGVTEGRAGQETLKLASIRSLRVLEAGALEAGVALISGSVAAVYCSLPEAADETALQALFLPAEEAEDIGATLITTGGVYEEGRALLIEVGGREVRARAGRLVSDSPVYERFEFVAE
ncbi:MAG: hypothetical protein R3308_08695, partial [Thiohalobacterales bacterium]|nr:hypothetical protein [Thiohalobacterales bacterium]